MCACCLLFPNMLVVVTSCVRSDLGEIIDSDFFFNHNLHVPSKQIYFHNFNLSSFMVNGNANLYKKPCHLKSV